MDELQRQDKSKDWVYQILTLNGIVNTRCVLDGHLQLIHSNIMVSRPATMVDLAVSMMFLEAKLLKVLSCFLGNNSQCWAKSCMASQKMQSRLSTVCTMALVAALLDACPGRRLTIISIISCTLAHFDRKAIALTLYKYSDKVMALERKSWTGFRTASLL